MPGSGHQGDTARRRYPTARQRPSYADLHGLLDAAREELRDADEAITFACFAVHYLSVRQLAAPHDAAAERRILGALVNGRATLRDVADLAPADFLGDGHGTLFAAVVAQLRQERVLGVRVRPSARRDPALRAYVAAETRVRAVGNALAFRNEFAARVALQGLPRPGACPRRDIVRVEELARWRRGER